MWDPDKKVKYLKYIDEDLKYLRENPTIKSDKIFKDLDKKHKPFSGVTSTYYHEELARLQIYVTKMMHGDDAVLKSIANKSIRAPTGYQNQPHNSKSTDSSFAFKLQKHIFNRERERVERKDIVTGQQNPSSTALPGKTSANNSHLPSYGANQGDGLRSELTSYILQRNQEKPFNCFLNILWAICTKLGCSQISFFDIRHKDNKISAAKKLLQCVNGEKTKASDYEKKALQEGRLGDIVKKYINEDAVQKVFEDVNSNQLRP